MPHQTTQAAGCLLATRPTHPPFRCPPPLSRSKFGVKGYPTLKKFGAEKEDPEPYSGGRTLEDLKKFAIGEVSWAPYTLLFVVDRSARYCELVHSSTEMPSSLWGTGGGPALAAGAPHACGLLWLGDASLDGCLL